MANENADPSLADQTSMVGNALEQINELSVGEIDQKIATIKTFIKEATDKLTQQVADLHRKYERQIALLEAARETQETPKS